MWTLAPLGCSHTDDMPCPGGPCNRVHLARGRNREQVMAPNPMGRVGLFVLAVIIGSPPGWCILR